MATAGQRPIIHQTYIECDGCEDEVDVEWYCLSCKSNLCGKCKTARLHRKHTIKAWMDRAAVSARQDAPMPCKIHPDKNYVNYCTECSVLCCSTCNAGGHSGHQFKTIEAVFDGKLYDMKKFVEELKGDCLTLATRKKEKLNKNAKKCNSQCTLNKKKIKQRIASLKNDLSLMEDTLIQDEESKRKENMKKLQKELSDIEETENKIAKAVKDIEKEISISNRQSIILTSVSFSTLGEFKVSEANDLPDREFKKSDFKFPSVAETVGLSEQRGESMIKPVHPAGDDDFPIFQREFTLTPGDDDFPIFQREFTLTPGDDDVPIFQREFTLTPGDDDCPIFQRDFTPTPGDEDFPIFRRGATPAHRDSTPTSGKYKHFPFLLDATTTPRDSTPTPVDGNYLPYRRGAAPDPRESAPSWKPRRSKKPSH